MRQTLSSILIIASLALLPFSAYAQFGTGQGAQVNSNNPSSFQGYPAPLNTVSSPYSSNSGNVNDAQENGDLYDSKQQAINGKDGLYTGPQAKTTSASAVSCNTTFTTFSTLIGFFTCIINKALIQIAVTLAFVYFIWGVVQYVLSGDSAEERKKSKQTILWGVIALFVIVAVWSIVGLFKTTLGL